MITFHNYRLASEYLLILGVAATFLVGCGPSEDVDPTPASEVSRPIDAPEEVPAITSVSNAPADASTDGLGAGAETFASRDAAKEALIEAVRNRDRESVATIMGSGFDELIPVNSLEDEDVAAFLAAYDQSHVFIEDSSGVSYLAVGEEEFVFPVPLSEQAGQWRYDLAAGAEEVLARRIGRNELDVMQALLAYVDAQREYASVDRNGDGILEYAQQIRSSEGQRDGLYWDSEEGDQPSPLGRLFADVSVGEPYLGYRYKILTQQGGEAEGGAFDYIIGGRMTGGFALMAWPAVYGETGVKSFIVNHNAQLYEKDMGPDTGEIAQKTGSFDPDTSWNQVQEID